MILDTLAKSTRKRVELAKQSVPFEKVRDMALSLPSDREFLFEKALESKGMSFICEVKKASPSKGLIAEDFPYLKIAAEYEQAGASAISVLTEPEYFKGSDEYLKKIAAKVSVPVLRKDFTIDAYQIYEAKLLGASAVLLICALLDTETIRGCLEICERLGLSALVEAHSEEEISSALKAGARIIGVNNRDLRTFEVDIHHCTNLRKLVPKSCLFVAESGIRTREDITILEEASVNGVLIGETLMRSPDKQKMLSELKGLSAGGK